MWLTAYIVLIVVPFSCAPAYLRTATLAFLTWCQLQVKTSGTPRTISSEGSNGKILLHVVAWNEYAFQLPCVWYLKGRGYHLGNCGCYTIVVCVCGSSTVMDSVMVWMCSTCSTGAVQKHLVKCNVKCIVKKYLQCYHLSWNFFTSFCKLLEIHCLHSPCHCLSIPFSNACR